MLEATGFALKHPMVAFSFVRLMTTELPHQVVRVVRLQSLNRLRWRLLLGDPRLAPQVEDAVSRLRRREPRVDAALEQWQTAATAMRRRRRGASASFRTATRRLAELAAPADRLGASSSALHRASESALAGRSTTAALAHQVTVRHVRQEYLELRNDLVLAHLGLVRLALSRMKVPRERHDDMLHEGALGLMRALECYDANKGARLSTYAMYWIRNAVSRAQARHERAIRVPTHALAKRRIYARHATDAPTESTTLSRREQIKAASGLSDRQIDLVESIPSAATHDLHEHDLVSELDPADALHRRHELGELSRALPCLGDRERTIIEHRFELTGRDYRTLGELAIELGLSRERVRQIQLEALDKLRSHLDETTRDRAA